MSPHSTTRPFIAMRRLGVVIIFFAVVTGTGRSGEGGGEQKGFFSSGISLSSDGEVEDVEVVDEIERLVLRRSRMTASGYGRWALKLLYRLLKKHKPRPTTPKHL